MATREFIEKRIEGKEKEITKLEKKIERILKAEASNWEVNPYYYSDYDLKHTNRDLEEARESLKKYQEELIKTGQKEQSRNVPAITEFLDKWYEMNVEFYKEQKIAYEEAKQIDRQKSSEYTEWFNSERKHQPIEVIKQVEKERRAYNKQFKEDWTHVTQFDHGDLDWETTMKKDLKKEYDRKYDFIIERTNEIVGTITDASGLRVGSKGDLNGLIKGTDGIASVQTIGAGGYNIQCFHFRTLINRY